MSVQSQLKKFNEKIKVDYDVKAELAEKRDILVGILRDNQELPCFKTINQGSYGMHIGVEPIDKEYDIDVGLKFEVSKNDYEPMDLKKLIFESLENHTEYGAKIKKSCVTVTYKKNGEAAYHVDLVTYVYEDVDNKESQIFIAKGIESIEDSIRWEMADPVGLIDYINNGAEKGKERDQLRRVIRYIKRWKNNKFSCIGNSEPPSIGITLIAVDAFLYYEDDDLEALIKVVKAIREKFIFVGISEKSRFLYRINLPLPISLNFEYDTDIFKKMADSQMTDFKDKIEKLISDLEEVKDEIDEQEKYKKLNKIFGDDFEIPDIQSSAKKQFNYIPSSSSSGME